MANRGTVIRMLTFLPIFFRVAEVSTIVLFTNLDLLSTPYVNYFCMALIRWLSVQFVSLPCILLFCLVVICQLNWVNPIVPAMILNAWSWILSSVCWCDFAPIIHELDPHSMCGLTVPLYTLLKIFTPQCVAASFIMMFSFLLVLLHLKCAVFMWVF